MTRLASTGSMRSRTGAGAEARARSTNALKSARAGHEAAARPRVVRGMAAQLVTGPDLRRDTAPRGIDLDARQQTFKRFVRGVFLFAAHVLVILALLALFRG
jgi:hypothetical protein